MRTITAIALATTLLFSAAGAHATTTHKRHHRKHSTQTEQKDAKAPKASSGKAAAPATK